MKHTSLYLVALAVKLCLCPLSPHAAEAVNARQQSFLFIGNSFTFRHNLPEVFKTLAAQDDPVQPIITRQITYGGRDMFRHFELFRSQDLLRLGSLTDAQLRQSIDEMQAMAKPGPEPAFYTEYWRNIDSAAPVSFEQDEARNNRMARAQPGTSRRKSATWDEDQKLIAIAIKHHQEWIASRASYPTSWNYVVLQSWRDVSANPETGYQKYATKFAELAGNHNTQPILYITAPNYQNAKAVTEPIDPEAALNEVRIAATLAKKIHAIVVPVPLAVYRLQKAGSPITLRYENDMHPNQCCAYLTACLFYAAVFNKSPVGLKLSQVTETKISDSQKPGCDPDGHPLTRVFTDEERTLLQRTAWETIQAFRKNEF